MLPVCVSISDPLAQDTLVRVEEAWSGMEALSKAFFLLFSPSLPSPHQTMLHSSLGNGNLLVVCNRQWATFDKKSYRSNQRAAAWWCRSQLSYSQLCGKV